MSGSPTGRFRSPKPAGAAPKSPPRRRFADADLAALRAAPGAAALRTSLSRRAAYLETIGKLWREGDVSAVTRVALDAGDPGVAAAVLSGLSKSTLSPGPGQTDAVALCTALWPLVCLLVDTPYDDCAIAALDALLLLFDRGACH